MSRRAACAGAHTGWRRVGDEAERGQCRLEFGDELFVVELLGAAFVPEPDRLERGEQPGGRVGADGQMVAVGSDRLGDVHVGVAPAVRQPGLAERADAALTPIGRRRVAAYRQARLEDRRPPVRDGFVTDDERREALRLRAPAEREGPVDRLVRPVERGREVAERSIGGVGGEAECDVRGHDRLHDRVTDDDRVELTATVVDQDRRTVLGGRAEWRT